MRGGAGFLVWARTPGRPGKGEMGFRERTHQRLRARPRWLWVEVVGQGQGGRGLAVALVTVGSLGQCAVEVPLGAVPRVGSEEGDGPGSVRPPYSVLPSAGGTLGLLPRCPRASERTRAGCPAGPVPSWQPGTSTGCWPCTLRRATQGEPPGRAPEDRWHSAAGASPSGSTPSARRGQSQQGPRLTFSTLMLALALVSMNLIP